MNTVKELLKLGAIPNRTALTDAGYNEYYVLLSNLEEPLAWGEAKEMVALFSEDCYDLNWYLLKAIETVYDKVGEQRYIELIEECTNEAFKKKLKVRFQKHINNDMSLNMAEFQEIIGMILPDKSNKNVRMYINNILDIFDMREVLKAGDGGNEFKIPIKSIEFFKKVYYSYTNSDFKRIRKRQFDEVSMDTLKLLYEGFDDLLDSVGLSDDEKKTKLSMLKSRVGAIENCIIIDNSSKQDNYMCIKFNPENVREVNITLQLL